MANVKPSAFGTPITPANTTILMGELAAGTAGRFTCEDLPYLAPYTGSASRPIEAKLAEMEVSANDFSGTATAKILAAAAVCAGTDKILVIPAGTWSCTQLDLLNVRQIRCDGLILSTAINADGYAVRIGSLDANSFSNANIKLRVEHSSGSNAGLSGLDGIRILGAAYATFELYAGFFGIGIAIRGSTGTQNLAFSQFNNCRTYGAVTGMEINNTFTTVSTNFGWCNQNQFNNCSLQGSSIGLLMQGVYPSDNNVFFNTEFEGSTTPIHIIMGKYNLFEWPRMEATGNIRFGDGTTASSCALNRIRMAYPHLSGAQMPQVTHDGFWPNFVEGPDGPVWRNILSLTIDDFATVGTVSHCPKLRDYSTTRPEFSSMVFNTAVGVQSFRFTTTPYMLARVTAGDVFRITIKHNSAITGSPLVSMNARNDADSANAATLSAGQIPYFGLSDTSGFNNGTSVLAPNIDIPINKYSFCRWFSVNRSDINVIRLQVREGVDFQWVKIDKLDTDLARQGDPEMPWPPVKVISSLATGPDYFGQMGFVTTSNLVVFAISATAWNCLTGTATWDPASIPTAAASAQATTTITVTGAAVGNRVELKHSISLGNLSLTGYVSAANTVTAVLQNNSAAAVDLGSGTVTAYVWAG